MRPTLPALLCVMGAVAFARAQESNSAGTYLITHAPQTAEERRADAHDLALKTQNPLADLIQFSMQNNVDFNVAPRNGTSYLLRRRTLVPSPGASGRRSSCRPPRRRCSAPT
jgi:hypothetical protein